MDWVEVVKSLVRPFIIIWGCLVYGVCILLRIEVPYLLSGLVTVVVLEYFGERALKRWREGSDAGPEEARQ